MMRIDAGPLRRESMLRSWGWGVLGAGSSDCASPILDQNVIIDGLQMGLLLRHNERGVYRNNRISGHAS
eukprot:3797000-Rhodomonas_salina.1